MNPRIETLRGLACLLLVVYHVIGADPEHGLRVADGLVRWINDGLAYLRMPLFTFLSGLVYGLRPFAGNSAAFLTGKARRLLLPMLFVGTPFAVLQVLTPGTNSAIGPWYLLHLQPVAHFWFVESLFWVFVVVWALERWRLMRHVAGLASVLFLSCLVYMNIRGLSWLGLEGAIYLMPYFLSGLALTRLKTMAYTGLSLRLYDGWVQHVTPTRLRIVLMLVSLCGVMALGLPVPNPDRRSALILLTGLVLCLSAMSWHAVVPWLASVGRYSYAIFLFHVFFTAAVRIALQRWQVDLLATHILIGTLAGLAGPMLLDRWVSRFKWPAVLLLGKQLRVIKTATVAQSRPPESALAGAQ